MNDNNNLTIALLIDAENISPKYMEELDKELVVLGRVTYKRMYGDFAEGNLKTWKDIANKYAITTIQQFRYTKGKNATDSKMIIDAMDILHENNVNAFCIMSSDCDFTGLAKRIKESNMYIIGAGEEKTPESFINVCDKFITLGEQEKKEKKNTTAATKTITPKEEVLVFVEKLLESKGGTLDSGFITQKIIQAFPNFNYKNYEGVKKSYDFFPVDKFNVQKSKNKNINISLND